MQCLVHINITLFETETIKNLNLIIMGTKKNFILDTNVILHDYKCLDNFEENDIYIPFVVLEELFGTNFVVP